MVSKRRLTPVFVPRQEPKETQRMAPQGYRATDRLDMHRLPKEIDDPPPWVVRVLLLLIAVVVALVLLSSCSGCQGESVQTPMARGAQGLPVECTEYGWRISASGPSVVVGVSPHHGSNPLTLTFEGAGPPAQRELKLVLPPLGYEDKSPPALLLYEGNRVCLTLGAEDNTADPCLQALRGATTCFAIAPGDASPGN